MSGLLLNHQGELTARPEHVPTPGATERYGMGKAPAQPAHKGFGFLHLRCPEGKLRVGIEGDHVHLARNFPPQPDQRLNVFRPVVESGKMDIFQRDPSPVGLVIVPQSVQDFRQGIPAGERNNGLSLFLDGAVAGKGQADG